MTPSPSSQLPDLSGVIVLVVDDDEDAIEVLTTMMTACGAEVLFARSASEGLAYLDTASHLDVVVTDISMPKIDGASSLAKFASIRPRGTGRCPSSRSLGFMRST